MEGNLKGSYKRILSCFGDWVLVSANLVSSLSVSYSAESVGWHNRTIQRQANRIVTLK